ncbi:hypothetical protein CKM354_001214700 [Cercospora kikuchii]|uniref:Amidase domain-containing protein n=1 Tax=Cercospora kikuchii TaxID=84275 RepID=A0A9P3D170_9PEZI|nr:uncharacterized protein CKM354_001214700 [Cercospora kikuchii]GIZ49108.1 hypothetical protein CKM354_001214700 [Cercospora kikuchii]
MQRNLSITSAINNRPTRPSSSSSNANTSNSKAIMHVLQPVPVPKGTPAFEEKREKVIAELEASIPKEFWLPESFFENPPLDVTSIPSTCGILTPAEIIITEQYDATGLAAAIAKKELSAVAVATAFCKRAAIAHQLTCCLTQYFMDEALERARYLDEYLATHGKTVGPLHGVPIGVKEHMAIRGHWSSWGYFDTRAWSEEDSLLVKILRDAGAVFYVKTNQPQGIMHLESDGWVGRVNNPHNVNLSSGGSTGGESALLAMKGSVLGLGTDIGGSIRGPSAFCGVFGYKPTSYTVTMKDMIPIGFPAELNVLCSIGPMSRTLRDVELFMQIVVGSKQYLHDPRIIPFPWTGLSTPRPNQPIKIGIMLNDGVITPQPPVLRALEWAQERLGKDSNFVLKPFKPYRADLAMKYIGEMYWPDAGINTKVALKKTGEPMHPLTKTVLSPMTTDFVDPEGPEKEQTATEITLQRVKRDEFRCEFVESWNEQDVDVVLAPCFVGPASKHDTAFYWNYTALWNFVDYPGIVVPTPVKVEGNEKYNGDWKALSEKDAHVRQLWEEGGFENAPINLQVIGRRYHDNQLIGIVGELGKVLRFA